MTEKQIRVLSLLATGIAIELILMAAYIVGRGHSERLLSTRNQAYAVGDNSYGNGSEEMGDLKMLYPEGAPITDEDHIEGHDPSVFDEGNPEFPGQLEGAYPMDGPSYADGASGDGYGFYDGGNYTDPYAPFEGYSDGYPVPAYGDSGGYGDYGYPAPQLPPTQYEVFPTDVPAQGSTPTVTLPAATLPPPTATLPAGPLPTDVDPYQPTATQVVPSATAADPTQPAEPTQPAPTSAATTPAPVTETPQPQTATPAPSATPEPAQLGGLAAVRAREAPDLNGDAGDAAWKDAPSLTVETRGGANQSATRVTVQAVYDDKNVYLLLRWTDPTNSFLYHPWEKQSDGSWKQLASAKNGAVDENTYFEDQLALFWNSSSGTDPMVDLWQWHSVRADSQAEDLYLDDALYQPNLKTADFTADPDQGGGPETNISANGKLPAYMAKDGGDRSGAPGYIRDGEKVPFDDGLFKPGERVPSVITAEWKGDRGDIEAAARYKDGAWTLEIRRALETGSAHDVQFSNLERVYSFGLWTYDNTQAQPAAQKEAVAFRFIQ